MAWKQAKDKAAPSTLSRRNPTARGRDDETSDQRSARKQTVGYRYSAKEKAGTPGPDMDGEFRVGILGGVKGGKTKRR